ncbi:microneme MIC14 [Babesia ovata]|uniref:Microneme MIC14 n=1 Tax=Babesia ovata TaxID=189622 RepID=A0A2H6KCP6_9APIC|nr:microneme MIC14 [Babesia ovata]GBE60762.1 microneme MIC14 [Babesia ovata]
MRASCVLALLCIAATAAAVEYRVVDTVYCNHTALKQDAKIPVEKCRELCVRKAKKCLAVNRVMPKDVELEGVAVSPSCFKKTFTEYDANCAYAMTDEVDLKLRIVSGVISVPISRGKNVTIANMTSPIVFAQLISNAGEHFPPTAKVKVNIIDKTTFNLSIKGFPAGDDHKFEPECFVEWVAIDECDKLKGFGHYHVHLQKYKVTSKETQLHSVELKAEVMPKNIAMFVQELSMHVEATASFITAKDGIKVEIQPTHLGQPVGKEGSAVSAEVAVLLVDMDHFKNGSRVMFGNVPISFPVWQRNKEHVQLAMTKPEQELIFFTPHYTRSARDMPVASCWLDHVAGQHGSFFCHLEPASLITLPHTGSPNFTFMMVGSVTNASKAEISQFRYKGCEAAYAIKIAAKGARPKPWNTPDDMACKKSCLANYHLCRGNSVCLQAYMNESCALEGFTFPKVETKAIENPPTFVDVIHVLSYELKGAVCTGLLEAAKIEQLEKHKHQWKTESEKICREHEAQGKQDDVLVVIDGHLSAKFCENIDVRENVEWASLASMRDQLVENGKAKSLEAIFAGKIVYGFCHNEGIIQIERYFDRVKVEPEEPQEDVSVDCVESEWEEWSPCSAECIPDTGIVIRKRVRYVLQQPSGNGRKCVIEETKQCTAADLPVCSNICLLTEWTDWSRCVRSKQRRERYVKSYSGLCDNAQTVEIRDCRPGGDDPFSWGDVDAGLTADGDGEGEEDEDELGEDGLGGGDYEPEETPDVNEDKIQLRRAPQSSTLRHQRRVLQGRRGLDRPEPRGYRKTHPRRNRNGDTGHRDGVDDKQNLQTSDFMQKNTNLDGSVPRDDRSVSRGGKQRGQGGPNPSFSVSSSGKVKGGSHGEAKRVKAQGIEWRDQQQETDSSSLLEVSGDFEDDNCYLWSEWSGCSSVCNDDVGRQYKLSSRCDVHSTYDLADKIEKRHCDRQEECGLKKPVLCKQVRSLYFLETDDAMCQEECERLLESCVDTKERNSLLCLAKLKTESADAAAFFYRCVLPHEQEQTMQLLHRLFQNRCFLSRASYSEEDNSWVNKGAQSCHCSIPGSVPCTAKEVHYTRNDIYRDLMESGFCPSLNYKQAFFNVWKKIALPDSLTYVSLAGNQRLHCPLGVDEETFTYTQFAPEELESYCRHGPIFAAMKTKTDPVARQYTHQYDCSTVISTSATTTDFECGTLCRSIRARCLSNHRKYLKCIKDRLTSDFRYESYIFTEYGCKLPPNFDSWFDEEYYRAFVATLETEQADKRACAILAQNAIMHCEAEELLNNSDTLTACMARQLGDAEPTTAAKPRTLFESSVASVERFKTNCKFNPARKPGAGYVMCRFPTEIEDYENWSQWSACSADCNDFESVATRYRTRKVAGEAKKRFFRIGEGTLQFELCLHLPGCERGRWIDGLSEEDNIHIVDYEAYSEHHDENHTNWLEQTYMQYPELRSAPSEGASCQIYKSYKIFSSKGTICGCPHGHKPCSFATAMADPMWMVGMQNFCQKRPLASIGFEGEIRDYRYYCNIGMLLMQTEYSGPLACEYFDNEEYVACQAAETTPITLRSKQFTLMGVCLGVVFCTYSAIMYLIRSRRKRNSAKKKNE